MHTSHCPTTEHEYESVGNCRGISDRNDAGVLSDWAAAVARRTTSARLKKNATNVSDIHETALDNGSIVTGMRCN